MSLEERVLELERRLDGLLPFANGNGIEASSDRWAAARLHEEFAATDEPNGGVLFAGSLRLPTDEQYSWQATFTTGDLIEDDWAETAECLAALGNPVRLRLLREIMGGRRTAAELVGLEGVGTSGQVYHHLRQLAAVGWLHTAGRGRFEVPAGRVVPLLIALASARR
ncbi:ArsR/SmtB family transcription factor [Nocardia brasiliensis]|uniref:ArsR/SmtB family transcription factor n=1 Tax=Nocardia brasiliensis TaxID=37326 RepID=UPI0005A73029|nr:winged helix-turn-helix domain-containing protein [Nocardia brasiliensis]ASF12114.1 ArsR family transcriptional regulator [Nocardia brasiliensis]SUB53013.1 Helix-turn-helix domain [Nocardia brasiliensis]